MWLIFCRGSLGQLGAVNVTPLSVPASIGPAWNRILHLKTGHRAQDVWNDVLSLVTCQTFDHVTVWFSCFTSKQSLGFSFVSWAQLVSWGTIFFSSHVNCYCITKHVLQSTCHELIPARNASLVAMQGSASGSNVRYYPTWKHSLLKERNEQGCYNAIQTAWCSELSSGMYCRVK
jgi:hypothetical protein